VTGPQIFSQDYIKACFNAWYLAGRPDAPTALRRIVPVNPDGKTPSVSLIKRWRVMGAWDAWADDLDAKVYQKDDKLLINKKAAMLRKQQDETEKVSAKALSHLIQEGFDSSNAAVQAFYKGHEEVRKIAGFSDLLEKLDKLTNNEVEAEIVKLLNRASDNDQIIDSELEDVGGEETESQELP